MTINPHYALVPKDPVANLKFRRELLNMTGTDTGAQAALKKMCAEDLLFYCNTMCWTFDPKNCPATPKLPFITYGFQDEAMLAIKECVDIGEDFVIPKSREMGASWMGMVVFEWFWHFKADLKFLLISRTEDYVDQKGNSKALFWKIDFLHQNQPRWLLPPGRWLGWKDPERRLLHLGNVENGSSIDGESTTGDAGRGDRRTAIFIDEHAAFDLNDGFRILRATRDATRCRGFNSTFQGSNNAFYEAATNLAARKIPLHWSRHPEKNRGLYTTGADGRVQLLDKFSGMVDVREKGEDKRRVEKFPDSYPFILDGKVRSPWYDGQYARCASPMEIAQELDMNPIGAECQFFDPATIEILRKKYCRPPLLVGDIEIDDETCEPKRFVENPKGKLELWLTLDKDDRIAGDRRFVEGADVSAGTGASNSVTCFVDRATGEKVGVWRDSNTRPNGFARMAIALARFFNKALMVWDASGPTGEVFTKRVVAQGYGNIYYRRNEKKIGRDITDEPGVFLNARTRETVFEDYRDALGSHRYINRSDAGMAECLQFIRKPDNSIEHSASASSQDPSGARAAHGDEVVADALACMGMTDQTTTRRSEEPEVPVGCLMWRRNQKAMADAGKGVDKLGEGW